MAKLTIAQLREREVKKLALMHNENFSDDDLRQAYRLMNSFYRLCGLAERNLYLANDERFCNTDYCKQSEEKESAWAKRLSKEFTDFAGLQLYYAGVFPSIGKVYNDGRVSGEIISRWFYQ